MLPTYTAGDEILVARFVDVIGDDLMNFSSEEATTTMTAHRKVI
jgi:hypothetical protein